MIKRLYLADGYLLTPLDKYSDDIAVDSTLATLLTTGLNIGDTCYLTIESEYLEVLRITRYYYGLEVERAQDGTSRQNFAANTKVLYKLTRAEISEAASYHGIELFPDSTGSTEISGGNINIPEIKIQTVGGIKSIVEKNKILIIDNNGMFGCCGSSVTGAPNIDGPYFYLTTTLYPYEYFDWATPTPTDSAGNPIPPVPIDGEWWQLDQPTIVGDYAYPRMQVLSLDTFGGAQTTSTFEYAATDMSLLSLDTFGGAQTYTNAKDGMSMDSYPLDFLLFGNSVEYNYAYDYASTNTSLLSLELI